MRILIISSGDFFSTYGGGQVYIKSLVDEMINQELDIYVISLKTTMSKLQNPSKKNYRKIDLYEIHPKDLIHAEKIITEISPDIIHIHAEKASFSKLSRKLNITNVVTAHHGGITCPEGALLNYKDEICTIKTCQKNCFPCLMKSQKCGTFCYPFFKIIPPSFRLKLGHFIRKLPFIYFVTPIGITACVVDEKQNDWHNIIDNTNLLIAPSQAIMENMIMNGAKADKVQLLPHGIPIHPEFLSFVKIEETSQIIKFFYVGRICHIKGVHILLNAFSQLTDKPYELHLIGDIHGKYEKSLVNKYKKNKNIIFHGKIEPENIYAAISNYHVMIHPAICMEVFGLNIAEALSLGKPVIATRCGGSEMQIQNKFNGILIPPNNSKSIVEAINWIIDHPEETERMSINASSLVISIKDHVKSLIRIYKNI